MTAIDAEAIAHTRARCDRTGVHLLPATVRHEGLHPRRPSLTSICCKP